MDPTRKRERGGTLWLSLFPLFIETRHSAPRQCFSPLFASYSTVGKIQLFFVTVVAVAVCSVAAMEGVAVVVAFFPPLFPFFPQRREGLSLAPGVVFVVKGRGRGEGEMEFPVSLCVLYDIVVDIAAAVGRVSQLHITVSCCRK